MVTISVMKGEECDPWVCQVYGHVMVAHSTSRMDCILVCTCRTRCVVEGMRRCVVEGVIRCVVVVATTYRGVICGPEEHIHRSRVGAQPFTILLGGGHKRACESVDRRVNEKLCHWVCHTMCQRC